MYFLRYMTDSIFLLHLLYIQGLFKWKGMKRRNNITVSIFAYATMGECTQTSRDVIGISIVDRSMQGHPHAQERTEALIKSTIQLTR